MPTFFDNIKTNIDKGIKNVTAYSKEVIETNKIRSQIREVEQAIQLRYIALGKKVYEMLNSGTLNQQLLINEHKEISDLFKKITQLEEEIKKVELEAEKIRHGQDIILCTKCKAPNNQSDKFCKSCGSGLLTNEPGPLGLKCTNCGAELMANVKFCAKCGFKLVV